MSLPLVRLASGLAAALALLLVLIPASAHADGELPPRTVGVDATVVLPLGDYGDVASLAVGPLFRAEFPIAQRLAITARAGVLYHITKSDYDGSLWFIPIYGGVRYSLGAGADGPYLAGELGITIAYARADTGFGTASDSDSRLGGSFGAGLRRGALDFRAALFIPDFDFATL